MDHSTPVFRTEDGSKVLHSLPIEYFMEDTFSSSERGKFLMLNFKLLPVLEAVDKYRKQDSELDEACRDLQIYRNKVFC